MAGLTLYETSVPVFTKGLKSLAALLAKAEEHAAANGQEADAFATERLVEGMLPLSFQVQVCSNTIKKFLWRVTGVETEAWEDNETTIAQLQARIQKTLDLLAGVDAKGINGKEDQTVELQMGPQKTTLLAKAYLLNYAMPNFFFHLQTTYCILRQKGVPLGKTDYLNPFMS